MQAGVIAGLYRDTQDGKVVTSRRVPPMFRRRWYYVDSVQREAFEKRAVSAHLIAMLAVVVGAQFVVNQMFYGLLWMIGLLVLCVLPVLQAWMTSGLVVASLTVSPLAPRSRAEQALLHSRALGVRTLWGFLVLGIILTIPQAIVAVVDGVWWAWLGVVMFGSMTVYFGHHILRLRAAVVDPRAT
jgi:hypothetical protein